MFHSRQFVHRLILYNQVRLRRRRLLTVERLRGRRFRHGADREQLLLVAAPTRSSSRRVRNELRLRRGRLGVQSPCRGDVSLVFGQQACQEPSMQPWSVPIVDGDLGGVQRPDQASYELEDVFFLVFRNQV